MRNTYPFLSAQDPREAYYKQVSAHRSDSRSKAYILDFWLAALQSSTYCLASSGLVQGTGALSTLAKEDSSTKHMVVPFGSSVPQVLTKIHDKPKTGTTNGVQVRNILRFFQKSNSIYSRMAVAPLPGLKRVLKPRTSRPGKNHSCVLGQTENPTRQDQVYRTR